MKTNRLYKKLCLAGGLLVTAGAFTSCEDYLTIYPTDKIVEADFWKDKNDVDNMRAAVYYQMASAGVTERILTWGELRSDNMLLVDMSKTDYLYLQDAILMPTNGSFDWSPFYKGINYCNKILENGEKMVQTKVDPSFTQGEWLPIKAEVMAMRALNYFYLVRAYRDVPYVEKCVNSDNEARNARHSATPGVVILDSLITSLEGIKDKAATNFGSTSENKGRMTKLGIRALLADMYLWRGCMLGYYNAKKAAGYSVDTVLGGAASDQQAVVCFQKAVEHSSYVINYMDSLYRDELEKSFYVDKELKEQPYPLIRMTGRFTGGSDEVYNQIWGRKNSSESIFDLQYDGSSLSNTAYATYFKDYAGDNSNKFMAGNTALFTTVSTINPAKGFGKTDMRFLNAIDFEKLSQTTWPVLKNLIESSTVNNFQDVTLGGITEIRNSKNANWPVYRLADVMLIKAEAIARLKPANNTPEMKEGFMLVNELFARQNPALAKTGTSDVEPEYICTRLDSTYYRDKNHSALLTLVYQERQREFFAEGKRWFDLVRQAEATNSTESVLADMMGAKKAVQTRLRSLSGMYCPIYSEEMKVNGVENGGYLKQNETWDRYTKN